MSNNYTWSGSGEMPQNFTTQAWDNQIPFSDELLKIMSGEEQADMKTPSEMIQSIPETLTNPIYTPGYLRKQIGKWMRVEFLIGNTLTERVGRLVEVGASYIILQSLDSSSMIMGDIYAIKFVTIYSNPALAQLYSGANP